MNSKRPFLSSSPVGVAVLPSTTQYLSWHPKQCIVPKDRRSLVWVWDPSIVPFKIRRLINAYGCTPPASSESTGTEAKTQWWKKKTYQHSPPKGSQRTVVLLFVENQNHLESIFQTRFLALSRLSFKEHPGDWLNEHSSDLWTVFSKRLFFFSLWLNIDACFHSTQPYQQSAILPPTFCPETVTVLHSVPAQGQQTAEGQVFTSSRCISKKTTTKNATAAIRLYCALLFTPTIRSTLLVNFRSLPLRPPPCQVFQGAGNSHPTSGHKL